MCPKCQGLLVRDSGLEAETQVKPAYRCANCGLYIDPTIVRHSQLTPVEKAEHADRARYGPVHTRRTN